MQVPDLDPPFPPLAPPLPGVGPLGLRALGEGSCIVLIHGLARVSATWGQVALALASRHRVLLPDHPGMGTSRDLKAPWSLESYARLQLETLRSSGEKGPFHLVGLSMGGMVALSLARELGSDCASLMLLASSTRESGLLRLSPAAVLRIIGRFLIHPRSAGDHNIKEVVSRRTRERWPDLGVQLDSLLRAADSRKGMLWRQLVACALYGGRRSFGSLPEKRIVVVGEGDRFVPPRNSWKLARLCGAPLYAKPGLGHDFSLDAPQWCAELIDGFVRRGEIQV